jgi:RNA polymerase sigma-70 factor (sigma-E family)
MLDRELSKHDRSATQERRATSGMSRCRLLGVVQPWDHPVASLPGAAPRGGCVRDRRTGFPEYFAGRAGAMRSTAYLLCGDWHRAEDLVQATFLKLYLTWDRVSRDEALDAYTRQILLRNFLDERRRGIWRRTVVTSSLPDLATGDPAAEDRVVLLAALSEVPPRQRAVLILRYWEDLSIEETARVLGCSTGTVKSQANRGLAALRSTLGVPTLAATPGASTTPEGTVQ